MRDSDTSYMLLGLSPDASMDDVQRAYEKMTQKFQPENYRDSPLADLAQKRLEEVEAAYNHIRQQRGISGALHIGGEFASPPQTDEGEAGAQRQKDKSGSRRSGGWWTGCDDCAPCCFCVGCDACDCG